MFILNVLDITNLQKSNPVLQTPPSHHYDQREKRVGLKDIVDFIVQRDLHIIIETRLESYIKVEECTS